MTTAAPYPKCSIHGTLNRKGSYLNGLKYNKVMYSTSYYCYTCLDEQLATEVKQTMAINISDIVDSESVLAAAFADPKMQLRPRKLPPTIDTALKAVVDAIEAAVIEDVAAKVMASLSERWEQFTLLRGDYADQSPQRDADDNSEQGEYESDADSLVEEACLPYQEYLSQNWLGKNTIDTALWLEDGVKKFSQKLGQEYYNNLVHQRGNAKGEGNGRKTPAQIMSSAGITQGDVQTMLDDYLANAPQPTKQQETETMTAAAEGLQGVLEQVYAHVGKDYDRLEVLGDLDLASDDDDNLSNGALPRIGLDASALELLREQRIYHGGKTGDVLESMLYDIATLKPAKKGAKAKKEKDAPAPGPAAKPPKGALAKEKAKRKKDEAEHEEETPAVPAEVLTTLKDCGGEDKALSEQLGISRATYNGYANGKAEFVADEKQRGILRNELVGKLNALGEALKALDGTEVDYVV
jgi:hypothetical protein